MICECSRCSVVQKDQFRCHHWNSSICVIFFCRSFTSLDSQKQDGDYEWVLRMGPGKERIGRKFTLCTLLIWAFGCRDVTVLNLVCRYGTMTHGTYFWPRLFGSNEVINFASCTLRMQCVLDWQTFDALASLHTNDTRTDPIRIWIWHGQLAKRLRTSERGAARWLVLLGRRTGGKCLRRVSSVASWRSSCLHHLTFAVF
jgi:hypothetical protein